MADRRPDSSPRRPARGPVPVECTRQRTVSLSPDPPLKVHDDSGDDRPPCMTYSFSPAGFSARSAFRTDSDCWKREGAGSTGELGESSIVALEMEGL